MSVLLRRAHSARKLVVLGAVCLSGSACADDALIRDYNDLPIAVAQVVRSDTGQIIEPLADGSLAPLTFPYAGSPVRISLRGENSRDPDGTIREYRWLSGTRGPDAGVPSSSARRIPAGAELGWPSDEANVTVDLDRGTWAFSLWVRDDNGAWSAPDTVRLIIGTPSAPPATDGGVAKFASMDGGPPTLVVGH